MLHGNHHNCKFDNAKKMNVFTSMQLHSKISTLLFDGANYGLTCFIVEFKVARANF